MGAIYFILAAVAAGFVDEILTSAAGDGDVSNYDYHFVPGVGAVFGSHADCR